MYSKFRESKNFQEIFDLIDKSASGQEMSLNIDPNNINNSDYTGTIVWQNIGTKRNLFKVDTIKINEAIKTIQLKLDKNDSAENDKIQKDLTVYVKLAYKDTVFKAKIITITSEAISLYIPEKVRTLELRENPRTRFKAKDEKFVTIAVSTDLMLEATQALKVKVIDISEGGIGVVISTKNKKMFTKSDRFILTYLGEIKLPYPIELDFRYIQPLRFRYKGKAVVANKAGMMAKGNIPKQYFDSFIMSI